MPVPQVTYPLDLTGLSPNNAVVAEPQTLVTGLQKRAFVPNHGPFYTRGLVVRDAANGQTLTPKTQYVATQLFSEASIKTGLEVCSVIVVTDPAVSSDILIDYQVVGGEFSSSVYAIRQLIDSLNLDDRPVYWGDILGKPEEFPPTPHLHDVGDLYGFEYIVAALLAVRQAIMVGDEAAHAAIYQYIDLHDAELLAMIQGLTNLLDDHIHDYNNPHHTTKTHVGLGLVENYPVASLLEAQQGTRNDRYMTPALVRAAILALADTDFSSHIQNMNNPHNTTKAQVGLSLVNNFTIATVQQAIDGTRNDLYLTPYLMRQAWLAWGGGNTGGGGGGDPEPPPGANVPPQASFTYSGNTTAPSNATSPTWVMQFTDTSVAGTDETATAAPIVSWTWNFGNATSTQQNPTYTFTSAGVKTITLVAKDSLNRTSTKTINLTLTQDVAVTPPNAPNFNFTNSTITAGSYAVSHPDGHGSTWVVFSAQGVPWKVKPTVTTGASLGTGYNVNNSYYAWDFSAGSTSLNGSNVSMLQRPISSPNSIEAVVFGTNSQEHTVALGVHIDGGTRAGDDATPTVRTLRFVSTTPPIPNASVIGPRTVLAGENFYFVVCPFEQDAVNEGGTEWSVPGRFFAGGQELTQFSSGSFSYYRPAMGGYRIESLDGGIFLRDRPAPGVTEVSLGNVISGSSAWSEHPYGFLKYTTPGTKTLRIEVWDAYDTVKGTYDKTFSLTRTSATPPVANFSISGQTNVVEGTNPTISFTNATLTGSNAIASYTWQFYGMAGALLGTFSGPNPPPRTFTVALGVSSATVILTVLDTQGLSSTKTMVITFTKTASSNPTANFSTNGSLSVVQGSNHVITFSNTTAAGTYPIVSWLWDFGDSTTSTSQNPGSHTYTGLPVGTTVRTVTLTATDSQGNSSVKTVNLSLVKTAAVAPTASFTVGPDTFDVQYNGSQVRVTPNNTKGTGTINSWLWNWGDGQTSTLPTPGPHTYTLTVGQTATFTVTLTIGDTMGLTSTTTRSVTVTRTSL